MNELLLLPLHHFSLDRRPADSFLLFAARGAKV
jgi:hypothetical protein